MSLSRQQLLDGASRIETASVAVPEWGGEVRLKAMSLGERLAFTVALEKMREGADPVTAFTEAMFRLVFVSMVDDGGQRLFADGEEDQVRALDFRGFAKIREAAQKLNGMAPPEDEKEEPAPL